MCLIALNWNPDHHYPLVLVANRDEFYQRPAREAHFWEATPDIFGGIDLQAKGTWLAVSQQGRLAALTNFRELNINGARTRGELISQFLQNDAPAEAFLRDVHQRREQYAGFNLLLADQSGLWHYSNRSGLAMRQLKPGLYGLSNALLDTPWPKVERLKKHLHQQLQATRSNPTLDPAALLDVLADQHRPDDNDLPDTGIGLEGERLLSSCFIQSANYGTRNSAALILDHENTLHWHERYYDTRGPRPASIHQTLTMPKAWLTRYPQETLWPVVAEPL